MREGCHDGNTLAITLVIACRDGDRLAIGSLGRLLLELADGCRVTNLLRVAYCHVFPLFGPYLLLFMVLD